MARSRFVVVYPSSDDLAAFHDASRDVAAIAGRSIVTTMQTPGLDGPEDQILVMPVAHAVFILADNKIRT